MRVLAGGPAREDESLVFALHRQGLEAQEGFDVEVRHAIVPDTGGERWDGGKVERVARVRQDFLRLADPGVLGDDGLRRKVSTFGDQIARNEMGGGFDGLWLVDSDVICGPDVLRAMWAVDAPVVYGVFWTVWPGYDAALPQAWDVNPYGFTEGCMDALVTGGEVPVYGGGACTLIRGRGFESRYYPLLGSLAYSGGMWGGEDRSYCLGLETRGIKQVAFSGLPIVHLYSDDQQTPDAVDAARQAVGL